MTQITRGDPVIAQYKVLAAEIVARGVKDYVLWHIFLRDDAKGRWNELYAYGSENQYKQWKASLDAHVKKKRIYRTKIREAVDMIVQEQREIEMWEKDIQIANRDLKIQKNNLEIAKRMRVTRNATGMTKNEAILALSKNIKQLDSEIARLNLRIEKNQKEITKWNVKIGNWRKNIDALRSEEDTYKKRMTPKALRKQLREEAEATIERYEEWFYSDQFAILAEISPEAVIDRTERSIAAGLDMPAKEFFFLDSWKSAMTSERARLRKKEEKEKVKNIEADSKE